jgi:hypothetical protein
MKLTISLVLRKPFISLARMVRWPEMFYPGDTFTVNETPAAEDIPATTESDFEDGRGLSLESLRELAAAQYIVEQILEHNGISLDSIKPADLKECRWLADSTVPWNEAGTEMLNVPDMEDAFVAYDTDTED